MRVAKELGLECERVDLRGDRGEIGEARGREGEREGVRVREESREEHGAETDEGLAWGVAAVVRAKERVPCVGACKGNLVERVVGTELGLVDLRWEGRREAALHAESSSHCLRICYLSLL